MGYINSGTTNGYTLAARLTTFGKEQILKYGIGVVTSYSFGDSNANYNTSEALGNGQIPGFSGDIGPNNTTNNGAVNNVNFRSMGVSGGTSLNIKSNYLPIDTKLSNVSVGTQIIPYSAVSGSTLIKINRTDLAAASTNYFYTFGLPISETDKSYFSAITSNYKGYADTAISGINQDTAYIISIPTSGYGNIIDGKSLKVDISTTGGNFTLYGTYMGGLTKASIYDTYNRDMSNNFSPIAQNLTFLFSDTIQKPNNDVTKSWATGHNAYKPFSLAKKELFNYTSSINASRVVDKAVGIAYLNQGFIVITNPTIVAALNADLTATWKANFSSEVNEVKMNFSCVKERGAIKRSTNTTFSEGDYIRYDSIALNDKDGNIIAIGGLNTQAELSDTAFLVLTITLTL